MGMTFQSSSPSICMTTVSCVAVETDGVATTSYPFKFLTRRMLKSSSSFETDLATLPTSRLTPPNALLMRFFILHGMCKGRALCRGLKGAVSMVVHRGNMWRTIGSVESARSVAAYASKKRRAVAADVQTRSLPTIVPRNANQELLLRKLNDDSLPVVIATGPAGSSKSLCCSIVGLRRLLEGRVKKLIIARPVASVQGEDIGYLPGAAADKLAPTSRAVLDFLHRHVSPTEVQQMIADDRIELCSIGMIRGRTFEDSWVIFDEASSAHVSAFKAVITRIGAGSKLVITGDEDQSDLRCDNGLSDFMRRLGPGVPGEIEHVRFTAADVVRHPVIKTILALYDSERDGTRR